MLSRRPALHAYLQLLQRLFFNSGYIGAADTTLPGNLPLCAGGPVVKAIAHCDYHSLTGTQAGLDALADLYTGVPSVQVFQHIVIHGDDIHQRQAPPLTGRLQGVGEGDLSL